LSQHANLTEERWSRFDLDQQILMIANEMHRTTRVLHDADPVHYRLGYERVLRLVDLTIGVNPRRALRRELLRWRDLVAAMYVAGGPQPDLHRSVFRVLLQLRPVSALQIPLLLQPEVQP
jgi:hypothetical protein